MLKDSVFVTEVGPRDGLQSIQRTMPTHDKMVWIRSLYEAGLRSIEVASFVSPKLLPQMADAALIVEFARSLPGLTVIALVPNLKGAQAAISAGAHRISVPCSASEAHSLANVRKTREQIIEEVRAIVELKNQLAPHVKVEAGVSVAFGCTIQGLVPEDDVIWMVEQLKAAGADELGLADTTGMGNPAAVRRLFKRAIAAIGIESIGAAHMHNTRGQGIANCMAAFEEGIRGFDTSLAGLGGCPYAPGASGNVVTEDLVFLFEAMGVSTAINLKKLIAARDPLKNALPGEPLHGMIANAGLPLGFSYAT